jgi:hypothetical protein
MQVRTSIDMQKNKTKNKTNNNKLNLLLPEISISGHMLQNSHQNAANFVGVFVGVANQVSDAVDIHHQM